MGEPKQVRAYIQNASGQLVPLGVDSVVLAFPSGDFLEVCWEALHPDAPHPVCLQVWGGRRARSPLPADPAGAPKPPTSVALLPSAANLVLIQPCTYPLSRHG